MAAIFTWFGMVLAISFIEAPLKFRAPGVTVQIGLGIGRLVFRALNTAEIVLAIAVAIGLIVGGAPVSATAALVVAALALLAQLLVVRPRLHRRTDTVLTGPTISAGGSQRSRAHYGYVVLEVIKVVALITGGVLLLAG